MDSILHKNMVFHAIWNRHTKQSNFGRQNTMSITLFLKRCGLPSLFPRWQWRSGVAHYSPKIAVRISLLKQSWKRLIKCYQVKWLDSYGVFMIHPIGIQWIIQKCAWMTLIICWILLGLIPYLSLAILACMGECKI